MGYVPSDETIDQRFKQAVGPDRSWPCLHQASDPGSIILAEGGSAKMTYHHAVTINHDTNIPFVSQQRSDLTDGGVEPPSGRLGSGGVGDPRRLVSGAL